ncbi:MAG: hypothetical protein AAE985_07035 [Thermoplasmataceae archaeon]
MFKTENNNISASETFGNGGMRSFVRIRNVLFLILGLLMIQFWLGMTINLEVNIPVKYLGPLQSLTYFGGHFAYILAHIVNGLSILFTSLTLLFLSFKTNNLSLKICAIFILGGVIGAITNGVLFLMSGQFFGWSVGMAMSAVSVLVASGIDLYFVGKSIQMN